MTGRELTLGTVSFHLAAKRITQSLGAPKRKHLFPLGVCSGRRLAGAPCAPVLGRSYLELRGHSSLHSHHLKAMMFKLPPLQRVAFRRADSSGEKLRTRSPTARAQRASERSTRQTSHTEGWHPEELTQLPRD